MAGWRDCGCCALALRLVRWAFCLGEIQEPPEALEPPLELVNNETISSSSVSSSQPLGTVSATMHYSNPSEDEFPISFPSWNITESTSSVFLRNDATPPFKSPGDEPAEIIETSAIIEHVAEPPAAAQCQSPPPLIEPVAGPSGLEKEQSPSVNVESVAGPSGLQSDIPKASQTNFKIFNIGDKSAIWVIGDYETIRNLSLLPTGDQDLLLLQAFQNIDKKNIGKFIMGQINKKTFLSIRETCIENNMKMDLQNNLTEHLLEASDDWDFDPFLLEYSTDGRMVPLFCLHLFKYYDLLNKLNIDAASLWKLFNLYSMGYSGDNPYHNGVHATDVTQAMHCFLQQPEIKKHIEPIEIMACLLSAISHDIDHPGINQQFMENTNNYLSSMYKNKSVLEKHHWNFGASCVIESGVAAQIGEENWNTLKTLMNSMILSTDISLQSEYMKLFNEFLKSDYDMSKKEDRRFVLKIALKCADISNPCRTWDISRKWSMKVCNEFFHQGDIERDLHIPISACCNRFTTSVPHIQSGFLKFVVKPLMVAWDQLLNSPLSKLMLKNLETNLDNWNELYIKEKACRSLYPSFGDTDVFYSNTSKPKKKSEMFRGKMKIRMYRRNSFPTDNYQALWNKIPVENPTEVVRPPVETETVNPNTFIRFRSFYNLGMDMKFERSDDSTLKQDLYLNRSIATLSSSVDPYILNVLVHGNKRTKARLRQENKILPLPTYSRRLTSAMFFTNIKIPAKIMNIGNNSEPPARLPEVKDVSNKIYMLKLILDNDVVATTSPKFWRFNSEPNISSPHNELEDDYLIDFIKHPMVERNICKLCVDDDFPTFSDDDFPTLASNKTAAENISIVVTDSETEDALFSPLYPTESGFSSDDNISAKDMSSLG